MWSLQHKQMRDRDASQAPQRGRASSIAATSYVHMHPAKRRFLVIVGLGGTMGAVLLFAMMMMVAHPLHTWGSEDRAMHARFEELDSQVIELATQTNATEAQMKQLLQQVQRLHDVSSTRTGLVKKAALHGYRELAREQLKEYSTTMKDAILGQISQRRHLEVALHTYVQGGIAAEGPSSPLPMEELISIESALTPRNTTQVETTEEAVLGSLSESLRAIQVTMLAQGVGSVELNTIAKPPSGQDVTDHSLSTNDLKRKTTAKRGSRTFFVYAFLIGAIGTWGWFSVAGEISRYKSILSNAMRVTQRMISKCVVVEQVDKSSTWSSAQFCSVRSVKGVDVDADEARGNY